MRRAGRIHSEHNDQRRRRPDAKPDCACALEQVAEPESLARVIARSVERTYLARTWMARRLQRRGLAWNSALVALSTSTVISSIVLLGEDSVYGSRGAYIFAVLGVLTLVASLLVASAGYQDKARHAFETYRQLQRLAVLLEAIASNPPRSRRKADLRVRELDDAYQTILDHSDNHSQADFASAIRIRLKSRKNHVCRPVAGEDCVPLVVAVWRWMLRVGQIAMSAVPVFLAIVGIVLASPAILWMARGF